MKTHHWLATLLVLIFIGGCAIIPPMIPCNPANPIKRLAVLPMQNDTSDLGGPELVRKKMVEAMIKHHYNIKPIEETDQILRDQLGITLGGQLEMASIEKLKEALDVEGLMFGTLINFEEITTGLYNAKKVRAKFKIINAINKETFWSNGIGIKTQNSAGGLAGAATTAVANKDNKKEEIPWVILSSRSSNHKILDNLVVGLASKLITKATKTHLAYESSQMIRRILTTLPMGPGELMVAGAPIPSVSMPQMRMPVMPSIGHLGYGDRDFEAVMFFTAVDSKGTQMSSFKMPFARAGNKIRVELNFSQMQKGGQMPAALSKMINIDRGDKKLSYTLYPIKKKYIVHQDDETNAKTDAKDDHFFEVPKIEKEKVGSEIIDGHPTDKYRVKVIYKNGDMHQGYYWNAKDLDGMTIKSEVKSDDFTQTILLKNIKLGTPPAALFEIPSGYVEAKGFMELMMKGN